MSVPAPTNRPPTEAETALAKAQAAKALAEADFAAAGAANARAHDERESQMHELQMARGHAEVTVAKIAALQVVRQERHDLSTDRHHQTYNFDSDVSSSSVKSCINVLSEWIRTSDKPLSFDIIFDSPGGNVIDGMHLWDFMSYVKSQGHHIRTISYGMAASMAGILLQAGDERLLGRESYVLIHEISTGIRGKVSEIEDEVVFMRKMQGRVLDIFAQRSAAVLQGRGDKRPLEVLTASRRRFFAKHWERKDWWLDSAECLKEGVVDALV